MNLQFNYLEKWRVKRRQRLAGRQFYGQFVRSGELCFDVGANVGDRTDLFLGLGARVVAVEPQPDCVAKLKRRFGRHPRLTIVPEALGANAGEAELFPSNASTLASMSKDWIEQVKASGRFKDYQWGTSLKVPVTTLDAIIAKHGVPRFCKIDVEGFEVEVLRGLSQPIAAISFEFVPEVIERALACIEQYERLGGAEFNWSDGESLKLTSPAWMSASEMRRVLTNLKDPSIFGDVYGRVPQRS